jgi:ubiquinol-cytochrome c reductase iron-sulfur subunit
MGPYQHKERVLRTTGWKEGVRLIRQNGTPVKLGDLVVGAVESVFPDVEHGTKLADSPALLIRMRPEELKVTGEKAEWAYEGPHRLLEHLHPPGLPGEAVRAADAPPVLPLPPVHVRGRHRRQRAVRPAARPLPQLAISVDEEGYFVAQGDFSEPTGPSYWERG